MKWGKQFRKSHEDFCAEVDELKARQEALLNLLPPSERLEVLTKGRDTSPNVQREVTNLTKILEALTVESEVK